MYHQIEACVWDMQPKGRRVSLVDEHVLFQPYTADSLHGKDTKLGQVTLRLPCPGVVREEAHIVPSHERPGEPAGDATHPTAVGIIAV